MYSFYYKNPDIIKYSALIRKTITTFGLLAATLFGAYAQTAQTITFTSPNVGEPGGGRTIALLATATSGGTVTFAVTEVRDADGNVVTGVAADAVVTLSGTTLTLLAAGTVTITATQVGGDIGGTGTIYAEAMKTQVITLRSVATFRVTTGGDAGNDGSSWASAMTLQAALAASGLSGDQVWIEAGTYKPVMPAGATPTAEERETTFTIPANVSVYGGFEGDESAGFDPETTARMGAATILSGDLLGGDLTDRENAGYAASRDDNSHTVVTITGADVTLDGLTITAGEGGNEYPLSGRIFSVGAGLLGLNNSTDAVVKNCMFTNNETNGGGPGTNLGGGLFFVNNVTLMDCTFTGNKADYGGGACFLGEGGGTAMLTNCTFGGNVAGLVGGGAYFIGETAQPMLTNCTFTGNTVDFGFGGGAYFEQISKPTLTNCTFTGNEAFGGGGAYFSGEAKLTNCVVANNTSSSDAGGISISGGTVINSTFYNNTATNRGGGILAEANDNDRNTKGVQSVPFNLQNSILVGNTAATAGNAIYFLDPVAPLDVTEIEATIDYNLIGGGEADLGVGTFDGSYTDLPLSDATNVALSNTIEESDASAVFVSIMAADDDFLRLKDGSPAVNAGNDAHISGILTDVAGDTRIQRGTVDLGAYESAFDTPQIITFTAPAVDITKTVGEVVPLIATTNAVGLFVSFTITTTPDTGVARLTDNGSTDGIGSLTLDGEGTVTVTASQTGGTTSGGTTYVAAADVIRTITVLRETLIFRVTEAGAATGTDGSNWTTEAMSLQAALAAAIVPGDQVWIAQGTYKPHADDRTATFTIPEGVLVYGGFEGDEAADFDPATTARMGAATILSGDLSNDDLPDRMDANYAAMRDDNSHTVVTITGADVTLDGLTITAGEGGTFVPGGFFSFGAGLYAGSSTAGTVVRNCMFTNNASNDAHRVGEDFTIYFGGGAYFTENATLIGCAFTGNTADLGGGASFAQTTTLTNCTFTGNEASLDAGGAHFAREANLTNCVVANNASGLDAGGISLPGGTVINSTFYNNTATERGGGILVRITDIDADMGGVQSVPFNLQNSILVGNTATTAGNAIYLVDAVAPFNVTEIEATIDYNLIGGGEADLGVGTFNRSYTDLPLSDATNVALSNTIEESDASAVFASIMAADDDFLRLKDTSPAVNAGNDAHIPGGILTDAVGDTRIQSSTVDLGAYESAFDTPQTITFTSPNVGEPGGGRTIALLATATSGGTVTFAVTEELDAAGNAVGTAGEVASLTNSTLTLVAEGTVTITATQAGGDIGGTDYAEAMQTQVITLRAPGAIFRVTTGGDMDADGSSWVNAMTLQAALAASGLSGDQIWIAAGIYKPHADDRAATFTIPANVSVYGGFEGNEAADFDPETTARMGAATILSGDLLGGDLTDRMDGNYAASRTDNSHTVVTITGADVTLDGLTITAGEGGTFVPGDFSSFGAGLYAGSSTAGAVVKNCMFTNNASNDAHRVGEDFTIYFGGGAYFTENVTLIGCAFTGNTA